MYVLSSVPQLTRLVFTVRASKQVLVGALQGINCSLSPQRLPPAEVSINVNAQLCASTELIMDESTAAAVHEALAESRNPLQPPMEVTVTAESCNVVDNDYALEQLSVMFDATLSRSASLTPDVQELQGPLPTPQPVDLTLEAPPAYDSVHGPLSVD
jgi:hypothetical protein